MATTADDPVFVDTNVLVYANTVRSPLHIRAQLALQDLSASAIPLWISRQILREYLATLSRPQTFSAPMAPAALVADVVRFQTQFLIAEDGPLVTSNPLGLLSTYFFGGKQVHDASPRHTPDLDEQRGGLLPVWLADHSDPVVAERDGHAARLRSERGQEVLAAR